jgi:hypothetical protein
MSDPAQTNSIPALLRDLRDETGTLLQQEVALAKSELKENAADLISHGIQIAVSGSVAYAGVIVLLIGLGHLLGTWLVRLGMSPDVAEWFAPAIVGLAVVAIGGGMLARAKHAMAQDDLAPRRTADSRRTNKDWAQNELHHST